MGNGGALNAALCVAAIDGPQSVLPRTVEALARSAPSQKTSYKGPWLIASIWIGLSRLAYAVGSTDWYRLADVYTDAPS